MARASLKVIWRSQIYHNRSLVLGTPCIAKSEMFLWEMHGWYVSSIQEVNIYKSNNILMIINYRGHLSIGPMHSIKVTRLGAACTLLALYTFLWATAPCQPPLSSGLRQITPSFLFNLSNESAKKATLQEEG